MVLSRRLFGSLIQNSLKAVLFLSVIINPVLGNQPLFQPHSPTRVISVEEFAFVLPRHNGAVLDLLEKNEQASATNSFRIDMRANIIRDGLNATVNTRHYLYLLEMVSSRIELAGIKDGIHESLSHFLDLLKFENEVESKGNPPELRPGVEAFQVLMFIYLNLPIPSAFQNGLSLTAVRASEARSHLPGEETGMDYRLRQALFTYVPEPIAPREDRVETQIFNFMRHISDGSRFTGESERNSKFNAPFFDKVAPLLKAMSDEVLIRGVEVEPIRIRESQAFINLFNPRRVFQNQEDRIIVQANSDNPRFIHMQLFSSSQASRYRDSMIRRFLSDGAMSLTLGMASIAGAYNYSAVTTPYVVLGAASLYAGYSCVQTLRAIREKAYK